MVASFHPHVVNIPCLHVQKRIAINHFRLCRTSKDFHKLRKPGEVSIMTRSMAGHSGSMRYHHGDVDVVTIFTHFALVPLHKRRIVGLLTSLICVAVKDGCRQLSSFLGSQKGLQFPVQHGQQGQCPTHCAVAVGVGS